MRYLIILLISFQTVAQEFSAATIPAELRGKAHAVIRNHEMEFYVKDIGEAVMKIKATITILDEKGKDHANIVAFYNKFTKVTNIEARIYDANGKPIKKLKKSDIESFSTSSGENSVDDSYVKVATLAHNVYPYTIDYTYEYIERNMMFYPTWNLISDRSEFTAVEKASFKVSMPKELGLRYKEQNMLNKVAISADGNRNNYNWSISNLKAVEKEVNSPSLDEIMPAVYTAPTVFKIDDYTGSINSWGDIGKFYTVLNADRDKLPVELTTKLKDLVKNETDVANKVKMVYEYLQANTRYVSIQLGIGGWQTMKAAEVSSKGYGDCKALTNFTKGMLKELGIPSYVAHVRAGENRAEIQADFPSFQFNHVILCVPIAKDTLWLECTSQTNPFGYLGSFTSDRNVLLSTENGGKLVRTPAYKHNDNQLLRNATIEIKENGEAEADIRTEYKGLQQEIYAAVANSLSSEEQKKWLYKNLSLPSVEIVSFSLNEKKEKLPIVEEKLNLHLRNIANKSGTRLFITPNILNQHQSLPIVNPNRKMELELDDSYLDIDNILFKIPKGYTVEYLPEPIKIETKFGKYFARVEIKDDIINYNREVSMFKGRHSATTYNEWVDFRKKIVKADKNQVVLVAKP
jgi:hypothetical protein